jgi:hypothetical protein
MGDAFAWTEATIITALVASHGGCGRHTAPPYG